MNGQLSEQPLAELIREISANSLAGRLQLEHERAKVAIYFDEGKLLYAASNLRPLRLREYVLKAGIAEATLARYGERTPDLELIKSLCADEILSQSQAEQIQSKQVSDVIQLALSWTENGTWDFDPRSRLNEAPRLKLETQSLLLEAGRRTPPKFAASRFQNRTELISPVSAPLISNNLLPAEVFLLSRLDRPLPLHELLAVSGLGENDSLLHLYTLALAGLVQRAEWKNVLATLSTHAARASRPAPSQEPVKRKDPPPVPVVTPEEKIEDEPDDVPAFLEKLNNAQTHYDVLGVTTESSPAQMKAKYYELARRYHPDRFRRTEPSLLSQIESAFARITQAYDTLRDDRLRAGYDAKLQARLKAQQLASAAPKPTAPAPTVENVAKPESSAIIAARAEQQFKEGFAALELGEKKVAIGLFAAAAKAMPNEARYRAFYGRMLAEHEHTRRSAEAEFQAAVKLDATNAEYRVMLAELYRDLGLMLRARGEAERALATDPNSRKARDLLHTLKSV
jgi:hypothetical protein